MDVNVLAGYRFLNLDLGWPGVALTRLEFGGDGVLTLARTPRPTGAVGAGPWPTTADAPAGIAVAGGCDCDLYVADPAGHRVWRFESCAGVPVPLACLRLDTPRGLAFLPTPDGPRLAIADSGNHRVVVVDVASGQVAGVWGQPDPFAAPAAGADPGRLDTPTDLAAGAAGDVYVVDSGGPRVQKFSARGRVDPSFWGAVAAGPDRPALPYRVAVAPGVAGGPERVYVLDLGPVPPRVLAFDPAGASQIAGGWPVVGVADPVALAATAEAVYLGGSSGAVARFDPGGRPRSTLARPGRPLAALAVGCGGELLAGPGGLPVERLAADAGFVSSGRFRIGPFQTLAPALAWHRWRVESDPLPAGAHAQLYTFTSDTPAPPPDGGDDDPFPAPGWAPQPRDGLDVLVLNDAVRSALAAGPPADPSGDAEGPLVTAYFWLGGTFRGDGTASPAVRQMRLDFNPATTLRYLPALYRDGAARRLFLDLWLGLLDGEPDRLRQAIDALPALFDPDAAPPAWLPWLAGWLDFDLDEDWPTADTRRHIAGAFALAALRGTPEGLRRYLKIYAGVDARVEEPGQAASLFTLDADASLGFNTRLAPAHEQGAVLGRTATLGQSNLLAVEDVGAPLFDDVAFRFCVQVYAAQVVDPHALDLVHRVLDRERPAHAGYHLCVLGPRMRVGFQARVGIDTIVAGPPPALRLDGPTGLGLDAALADRPHASRRLGRGARVGGSI